MQERTLRHAVELALQAPSVHNTQPWRFRLGPDVVELHADDRRHLPGTDPDRRDLVISCGAVLHHLLVAAAGLGLATEVERFPDPERRDHLATVRLVDVPVDRDAAGLYGQLGRRRTDRRPFGPQPIPDATVASLVARAARSGVTAIPVTEPRAVARMHEVYADAAREQRFEPGYLAELLSWTHRYSDARDGVPAEAVPAGGQRAAPHLQRFPAGSLVYRPGAPDGGMFLVLTTTGDRPGDRLAAGEATSAVLLAASRAGLAGVPLSQALELPRSREQLRARALGTAEHPQLVLRLGIPQAGAAPLKPTPRRPLASVLLR